MTHISKRQITDTTYARIVENFSNALFGPENRGRAILHALLTPTERIMLAKRLALITMLEKEYSYYRINKTLNMSVSTIMRFHRTILAGGYAPILSILVSKKKRISFLDELELLLSGGGLFTMAGPRYKKRLRMLKELRDGKRNYTTKK